MELAENLFVIAQLAVTLAGFASLVAVVGRSNERDDSIWDASRLEAMLTLSLFAGAFALLPFVPYNAGLSQSATWAICTGLFALSGAALSVYTFRKLRKIPGYSPATPVGIFWIVLSTSALCALAAASLGWLPRPGVIYLWGLYVYLALAALFFFRLVISLLAKQME